MAFPPPEPVINVALSPFGPVNLIASIFVELEDDDDDLYSTLAPAALITVIDAELGVFITATSPFGP